MYRKQNNLYMIVIFIIGLLAGLTLGSFTSAFPRQNGRTAPNVAEGAEIHLNELPDGPSGYNGQDAETYQGYLGVFNDHLAIFDGLPPNGTLKHIMTDFEVRDDVRPQLETGIPFTDTYDLLRLLENYTS